LVNQLGSSSVAIISSCSHALKAFESIASQKSILMKYSLVLEKDDQKILESIVNFLREKVFFYLHYYPLLSTFSQNDLTD